MKDFIFNNAEYISFNAGMLISSIVLIALASLLIYIFLPEDINKDIELTKNNTFFYIIKISLMCGIMFLFGYDLDVSLVNYPISDFAIILIGVSFCLMFYLIAFIASALIRVIKNIIKRLCNK